MELHYVYPQKLEGYEIAGPVIKEDIRKEIEKILRLNGTDAVQSGIKKARELIAGVVITSPTYDGVVSDIEGIARLVHSFG